MSPSKRKFIANIYLPIITRLKIWSSFLMRLLVNVTELIAITKDSKINILFRYYIIRLIDYVVKFFRCLRNSLDINIDKALVHKNYSNGSKNIILDSKDFDNNMRIIDIINNIDKISKYENIMNQTIYLKCELHNGDNKLCLKKYLLKYKDHDKKYNHTLNNILLFEDVQSVKNDAYIEIMLLEEDGGEIEKNILYDGIRNVHINDIPNFIKKNQ